MAKYQVISSFGGKKISTHSTLRGAKLRASKSNVPVDVWTTSGGSFGMGVPVAHFSGGKDGSWSSSRKQNPTTSGHPVTAIATVKTVNALYKAQKLLRMNGAPIPHVWKSGKVFKIGYTSSNTEGIRKGIAALSGSTGVQLVQNPAVSLPRNKWVNASIRITPDGKIQAKVSSPALSRSIRKRNPSSKKPSKYPKCSLCGKAIRDSTYTQGPDGPEHNVCPPTRGSGLYYMSRNPRRKNPKGVSESWLNQPDTEATKRKMMKLAKTSNSLKTLYKVYVWAGAWNQGGDVFVGNDGIRYVIHNRLKKHGMTDREAFGRFGL